MEFTMSTLELLQDILIKDYTLTRAQLAPDAQLAALGVDSLGLIELMFKIEDRFGITLPEEKPPALVTVSDLVAYIDQLLNPRAGEPPRHHDALVAPLP
jgi:acyl carrier protein